ncbi:hypothetical protein ABG795_07455 [Enterobacter soli]
MNKEDLRKGLYFLFIFISTTVFFTTIHPVTVISGDDWINLSTGRPAIPEWNGFNPIKVLPEISFPFFGNISSSIMMLFGFNFFEAIAYTTAILIAILVVAFLYQLYMLYREKTIFSEYTSFILVSFYFLCLFGMFRTLNNNNSPYMLWEQNITCYYHYIIPALLNGIMSLFLIRKSDSLDTFFKEHSVLNVITLLLIYLSIFSNIFASIFLAVVCGAVILFSLLKLKFDFIRTIKKHPLHVLTLIVWLISAIFEMNGGRADRMAKDHLEIHATVKSLFSLLSLIDLLFLSIIMTGVAVGLFVYIFKRNEASHCTRRYVFWVVVLSGIITSIGLLLICAKASPGYATRPAAMWGLFMFMIIAGSLGLGYLLTRFLLLHYVAAIVLLCLVNTTTGQKNSLRESHNGNVTFNVANAIGQNIIDQVKAAENENKRSMILYVPKGDNKDNWPFPITRGKAISETLKSNGIINKNIQIEIVPDKKLNIQFDMPM